MTLFDPDAFNLAEHRNPPCGNRGDWNNWVAWRDRFARFSRRPICNRTANHSGNHRETTATTRGFWPNG